LPVAGLLSLLVVAEVTGFEVALDLFEELALAEASGLDEAAGLSEVTGLEVTLDLFEASALAEASGLDEAAGLSEEFCLVEDSGLFPADVLASYCPELISGRLLLLSVCLISVVLVAGLSGFILVYKF
jgi:hypothetical protein